MNCSAYLSVYYKIIVVAAVSAIDSSNGTNDGLSMPL